MKELILIRGLPNAGKTSLAKLITPCNVAADDYFYDENGRYDFNPRLLKDAHEFCQAKTLGWMIIKKDKITVHNTFTTMKEMKPYFDMAEEYGYTVRTVIVENRHNGDNGHNVPESTVNKMRNRFEVKL